MKVKEVSLLEQDVRPSSVDIEDLSSPLFIAWQINSLCNLDCLHCCEEAGHQMPDELTRDEALDLCRQIAEMDIPYAAISGGEPLLCPYFFDAAKLITDNGISLKVETNGHFIDEKTADKFKEFGFRSVQISIDGVTPETHEAMRIKGDWQKSIDAVKRLVKRGVNTEIVFVPTKFNLKEISPLIDLAASLGVYGFYTGKIMRIGRAAKNWDRLAPSEKDYEDFFKVLQKKEAEYNGQMKVYYYPYDVVEELKYRMYNPSASLLIIPNGKVKLIGPLPYLCGDLRKHSLKEIWQRYKQAWKRTDVLEFTQEVIKDNTLLAQSNTWRELDI